MLNININLYSALSLHYIESSHMKMNDDVGHLRLMLLRWIVFIIFLSNNPLASMLMP